MRDRQTGSVWTHYDGTVLTGPLVAADVRLEFRPINLTSWGDWTAAHPDTTVLDNYDDPRFNYYGYRTIERSDQLGRNAAETVLNWDDRLSIGEIVVGVNLGAAYRAYVLADFDGVAVVEDTLADTPIVVFINADTFSGQAFEAAFEGQEVAFAVADGKIVGDRGSTWNLEGTAISGPRAGAQLTYVTSFVSEWYGWAAYHPETTIYGDYP